MKKLLAMTLAVALAVTTVAATTSTASAKHRDWGWPFAAGALLGFGLGYSVHPRRHYVHPRRYYYVEPHAYYPKHAYRLSSAHVDWCLWRYRTYNPATNTFFIRRGVPAVCVSPYSPY
jgi:hypothetical protein